MTQPAVDNLEPDFLAWLTELNTVAVARHGMRDGYWQGTGADCWRDYFEDGYTPAEALVEDMSYG